MQYPGYGGPVQAYTSFGYGPPAGSFSSPSYYDVPFPNPAGQYMVPQPPLATGRDISFAGPKDFSFAGVQPQQTFMDAGIRGSPLDDCNWFFLNCTLRPQDLEDHSRHVATKVGTRMAGSAGSLVGKYMHTDTVSDETIFEEMLDTVGRTIQTFLRHRRFTSKVHAVRLPPLSYNRLENEIMNGEIILVYKVVILEVPHNLPPPPNRARQTRSSWSLCCGDEEVTDSVRLVDVEPPLPKECQELTRKAPPEIQSMLQRDYGLMVKVEGQDPVGETSFLGTLGWPRERWVVTRAFSPVESTGRYDDRSNRYNDWSNERYRRD